MQNILSVSKIEKNYEKHPLKNNLISVYYNKGSKYKFILNFRLITIL